MGERSVVFQCRGGLGPRRRQLEADLFALSRLITRYSKILAKLLVRWMRSARDSVSLDQRPAFVPIAHEIRSRICIGPFGSGIELHCASEERHVGAKVQLQHRDL